MSNIPPEIALKAAALKAKYAPFVREVNPNFVNRVLSEAEKYNGLYIAYWQSKDTAYMVIFRTDRPPTDVEILPWLRVMFDRDGDGRVHEWANRNYRFFFEGNVYTTESVADMMGNAFANSAEKDSNAGAFDFDKTQLGKKLMRNRNGR